MKPQLSLPKKLLSDIGYTIVGLAIFSMALMADIYDSITKRSK